ncbi:hypothetical protein Tco_0632803, partial [Tanacetum coccineum]
MKKLIAEFPTLTAPMEKEELICVPRGCTRGHKCSFNDGKRGKANASLLCKYDIQYRPITSVKGQILADFIVECPEDDPLDTSLEAEEEFPDSWTLFTDRSSCIDGSGVGLILTNLKGSEFTYALRFSFAHLTKQVLVEELKEKSISKAEVLAVVEEEGDTWMTPIYNFLMEETLPAKKEKARAVRRKSGRVLRYACHDKICGSKGHTDGILLANNACGCEKDDKGMSRLP